MTRLAMLVDIEPQIDPAAARLRSDIRATRSKVGVAYRASVRGLGGAEGYSYASLAMPGWATIDPVTGDITGTPPNGTTYGTATVRITDALGATVDVVVALDIVPQLTIVGTLAPCEEQVPYSSSFQTTGAAGTLTWSTPIWGVPGLSINAASGLITGLPTVPGSYPVRVSVTDGIGVATIDFVLVVAPLMSAPPAVLPPALVGADFAFQLPHAGGQPPYTIVPDTSVYASITSIPGLSLDPNTGWVTGRPTAATGGPNQPFSVTFTDLAGAVITQTYYLTVNMPTPNPAGLVSIEFFGDGSTSVFAFANPFAGFGTGAVEARTHAVVYDATSIPAVVLRMIDVNTSADGFIYVTFTAPPALGRRYFLKVICGTHT
ncbi:putative Ig domain-containing protein [Dokdonella sp. MW10]|uniref:putative Ig domain-containing protein n=1 Tax=Dokdonella sp. MW10 TaxID=2992926 RepID=UPI003F7EBDA9